MYVNDIKDIFDHSIAFFDVCQFKMYLNDIKDIFDHSIAFFNVLQFKMYVNDIRHIFHHSIHQILYSFEKQLCCNMLYIKNEYSNREHGSSLWLI